MRRWLGAGISGLALCTGPIGAAVFDNDEEKSWVEQEAPLPAFPKTEDLIVFNAGAATSNRFQIDPASIGVGADGVVRFTLVVRSSSGAENISFEGIRCSTRERKAYAFGRPEHTWSAARSPRWVQIRANDLNNHYSVLYFDHFCRDGRMVRNREIAIRSLKWGPAPRGD
jgi:hypothetical protein